MTVDTRSEKIGKKIRDAQMEKIPYMLVVGDRDIEAGTVSPRNRADGDLGAMTLDAFTAVLKDVVDNKLKNMGGCNGLRFIGTLDKSKVSGTIKITKAPSARTVWPRLVNQLQVKLETVTLPSGGFGHLCGW